MTKIGFARNKKRSPDDNITKREGKLYFCGDGCRQLMKQPATSSAAEAQSRPPAMGNIEIRPACT